MRLSGVLILACLVAASGCGGGDDATDQPDTHEHDGDSAHHHDDEQVTAASRCDLGFNTEAFNEAATLVDEPYSHESGEQVDFTMREWADVFVDESTGMEADAVADFFEDFPERAEDILSGNHTHRLAPNDWVAMTDPAECEALADELQQAREAAMRYPTVADAVADGYTPASFYAPGNGAHYGPDVDPDEVDPEFDPSEPAVLMFDGHDPDDHLVGVMYGLVSPNGPPDDPGFTGNSDVWHAHETRCLDEDGMGVPRFECTEGRGTLVETPGVWMAHAWVVPGCENDWGIFADVNPDLPILLGRDTDIEVGNGQGARTPFASGCNSGDDVTDPLELDESGEGPSLE